MRISKTNIDWRFLGLWVGIGFVAGIVLSLETRLSLPGYLLGFASALIGLTLEFILLRRYIDNAKLFVFLGVIWVVGFRFLVAPFVESMASEYSQNAQTGFPPFQFFAYFLAYSLLLRIGQTLILQREFDKAYLWIIGDLVASIILIPISFPLIQAMAQSPLYAYVPFEILRFFDPISLVTIVLPRVLYYLIIGLFLSLIFSYPKNKLESI